MKIAYADPPYLGLAVKFYGEKAAIYDTLDGHAALVKRLMDEFRDGRAMSLQGPALWDILPLCPRSCRVGAWVKPFASFKPGVNPAYAWEPVIFHGGRKRARTEETVADFCSVNIAMRRGFKGAKPEAFCFWLFDLLGARPGDEFCDLFPGSGAVGAAWEKWRRIKSGGIAVSPNLFEAGGVSGVSR